MNPIKLTVDELCQGADLIVAQLCDDEATLLLSALGQRLRDGGVHYESIPPEQRPIVDVLMQRELFCLNEDGMVRELAEGLAKLVYADVADRFADYHAEREWLFEMNSDKVVERPFVLSDAQKKARDARAEKRAAARVVADDVELDDTLPYWGSSVKYAVGFPCDQTHAYLDHDGYMTISFAEARLWDDEAEATAVMKTVRGPDWWHEKYPDEEWAFVEEVEDEATWRAQPDTW